MREQAAGEFKQLPLETRERFAPDLMVALDDENPAIRQQAAKLLQGMGSSAGALSPEAQKILAEEQKKNAAGSRQEELQEIQKTEAESFPDLNKELREEKSAGSLPDVDELKKEHSPSSGSMLQEALKDPDPWVRSRAAHQLSLMDHPPVDAIAALTDLLGDPNAEVRASAAGALAAYGPAAHSATGALLQRLADPDPAVRAIVAEALKQVQSPPSP